MLATVSADIGYCCMWLVGSVAAIFGIIAPIILIYHTYLCTGRLENQLGDMKNQLGDIQNGFYRNLDKLLKQQEDKT